MLKLKSHLVTACGITARHAKSGGQGRIATLGRFCASLRATLNLVAKGGIEPPTQGFSELKRGYDGLRPGTLHYDYLNIFRSLSYTELDWPFLDFRSAIY
ncbi:MAG TPA: hypothetical protein VGT81_10305 [Casimicrobiaceae bacterium]|nr:hypothetical protein [Casimicrobiaceae bacterium]